MHNIKEKLYKRGTDQKHLQFSEGDIFPLRGIPRASVESSSGSPLNANLPRTCRAHAKHAKTASRTVIQLSHFTNLQWRAWLPFIRNKICPTKIGTELKVFCTNRFS